MDERSNPMANVALACGVGVWVLFCLGMCIGFIPFLNLFAFVFVFLEFVVALAGVITGILGWRQSRVSSFGAAPALVGLGLSLLWFLVEGLLMVFTLGLLGLLFVATSVQ